MSHPKKKRDIGIFRTQHELDGEIAKVFGENQYTVMEPDGFYDRKRILLRHEKCGFIFSAKLWRFYDSKGCPKCAPRFSKGEYKIMNFFKENDIDFQLRKQMTPDIKFGFLVRHNTVLEYRGMQYFIPTKEKGGEEGLKQFQAEAAREREYCKLMGFRFIEIPYTEYDNLDELLIHYFGSTTSLKDVDVEVTTPIETVPAAEGS